MKNYTAYTMEDFVGDEDFRNWVQGRGDSEEFWKAFMETHPDKKEMLKNAQQIILVTNVDDEHIIEAEIEEEVDKFLRAAGKINGFSSRSYPGDKILKIWPVWLKFSGIAALLILGIFLGAYFFYADKSPLLSALVINQMAETTNDSDNPLRLILSDHSVVILSPNSRLRYPSQFTGNSRKVYLTGEANFSVTHTSQPFMVYAGEMVTKVLGTRFVVRAFEKDKKISVQVLSGKVSVYSEKPSGTVNSRELNGLILTVNQAAIFEKGVRQLSKTLVSNPIVIAKENKVVNYFYDEVPLPVIFKELEKGYGIPIQFDEQNFEKCHITATLANETLYEKLDLLCKTVSASYEIVDGQIAISGSGCD
ncbi:FecR family protein [Dyadobacter sp. LHD-138]|uniref:FecR family protein n=1 Tax=Dyadobacter sp. LHD-138 TaxID=3071413 RepID=UPI0027E1AC44|nr:FecR family protein [Dyadobacter sp. LHD-138]MDQ6477233.1 FecR family protein [Dyadobacter sp. LHD-138]